MLDGSGVKAMPGLIPTPNSGSLLKNKKIQVAKWGTPKKYFKKVLSPQILFEKIKKSIFLQLFTLLYPAYRKSNNYERIKEV